MNKSHQPNCSFFSAFSSFPDGPQMEQGSQMHSFRIRLQSTLESEKDINGYERPVCNDGFLYGFSHFTQRRDPSSKRGYQQVPSLFRRDERLLILNGSDPSLF